VPTRVSRPPKGIGSEAEWHFPGELAAPLYSGLLYFVPQAGRAPFSVSDGAVRLKTLAAKTSIMVPDECGLAIETGGLFTQMASPPQSIIRRAGKPALKRVPKSLYFPG